MIRPTAAQEAAIRTAIGNGREGDATVYTSRTIDVMERNGWIIRTGDHTYRITPYAVAALGMHTLHDAYLLQDLQKSDPAARRQAEVAKAARAVGINVDITPGITNMVSIHVESLATMLDALSQRDETAFRM